MSVRRRTVKRAPSLLELPPAKLSTRVPGTAVFEVRGHRSRVRVFVAIDLASLLHGLEAEIDGGWDVVGIDLTPPPPECTEYPYTYAALLKFTDDDTSGD